MEGGGHSGVKQKVLIAGGGVAGLETALALRDLSGERVEVEVWDPRREFVFRPFAVGEPYGAVGSFRYDLGRLAARCGARHRPESIVSADPARHFAVSRAGERVRYDHLVVANGARLLWSVPGAATFLGAIDEGPVGDAFADLRGGRLHDLVFTRPPGRSWVLPLYHLALHSAAELARIGGEARLTVLTPEEPLLEVFGPEAAVAMGEQLGECGIEVLTGARPLDFERARLRVDPGPPIAADAVISLPRLEGRRVAGVPHDREGFVAVDEHCRVEGLADVYAAGDVTAFPLKHARVAAEQANAVAEALAAAVGSVAEPRPFDLAPRADLNRGHRAIGRYLGPLFDALTAEAEEALAPGRSERSRSHG